MRKLLMKWLGIADHEGRLKDLERHFVTKRAPDGQPTETLADVPLKDRKDPHMRGLSVQQLRHRLEATDGGRRLG